MLRITKGVVVLLSLGGLVCQFASIKSSLTNSPKNQKTKSYISNSLSTETYLNVSDLFILPKFSAKENLNVRPKLVCPHDVTELNCGDALPLPVSTLDDFLDSGGSYEEFCEGAFSISVADLADPSDLNYCTDIYSLVRRRYTLTDECGYSKSCLQRFTYQVDNTPPVVDCSAISDVYVGCEDYDLKDQVSMWTEESKVALQAASSDNCTAITVSHDYQDRMISDFSCESSASVMVTFYINDACNQRVSCSAKILPRPPRPDLGQPHDMTGLSCGSSLPPPATTIEEYLSLGGLVEEHCGKGLTISHEDIGDMAAMDFCSDRSIIIRRRYTVIDGCGNKRSTIQRFEFKQDTEAPSIDCGAMSDFEIDCDKALLEGEIQDWITSMQNKIMKSASDNCGGMTVTNDYKSNSAAQMNCTDGEKMVVSFVVSDACGNTTQCGASIVSSMSGEDQEEEENTDSVEDNTEESEPTAPRPEVVCVDDIVNIRCGESLPLSVSTVEDFVGAGGEIIQFCDGALSITSEDIGSERSIDICSSTKNILRRRYIIKDDCGNEKRCLQRIVYEQDSEAPQVDCDLTNDLIIDCDIQASQEDIDTWLDQVKSDLEVASIDNCTEVVITNDYVNESVDNLSCNGTQELVVTYLILDRCGNATSCSVSILKEDTGSSGLVIGNRQEVNQGSILYQNSPNPFEERTSIKFELTQAAKVRFTVYDLSGKLLFEQSKEHNEGINTINITRDLLNNISGVVFYALETNGFKEVKTMIILE